MNSKIILCASLIFATSTNLFAAGNETFPDGTPVSDWFKKTDVTNPDKLGKKFVITEFGVTDKDSTLIQTAAIQAVIDKAAEAGGGVIVIPQGTFLSGSLFFKPGTHLYVAEGGKLKGSDAITNYKIVETRLEGQTLNYFAALVNADNVDGFTITGPGTIDGNGERFWDEFWLRRKVNPKCTNLEALRPRLIYISNSDNITVSNIKLINSGFWTNHLYRCNNIKYINCYIYARTDGYPKGPSTDAIDLDACNDVLVKGCYMNVNDDAVCLKGGKGTFVDLDPKNGGNQRIIVEDCFFGKTNAGITFGSEAWDCSNVILRNCEFNKTHHIVLFKMRPDTPQSYRNVLVDGIKGHVRAGVEVSPWTQFFNPQQRDDMPRSGVKNVTVKNVDVTCDRSFYAVKDADYYDLNDFTFNNITATDDSGAFDTSFIENCSVENVSIEKKK
jgi:polygalacturonase